MLAHDVSIVSTKGSHDQIVHVPISFELTFAKCANRQSSRLPLREPFLGHGKIQTHFLRNSACGPTMGVQFSSFLAESVQLQTAVSRTGRAIFPSEPRIQQEPLAADRALIEPAISQDGMSQLPKHKSEKAVMLEPQLHPAIPVIPEPFHLEPLDG